MYSQLVADIVTVTQALLLLENQSKDVKIEKNLSQTSVLHAAMVQYVHAFKIEKQRLHDGMLASFEAEKERLHEGMLAIVDSERLKAHSIEQRLQKELQSTKAELLQVKERNNALTEECRDLRCRYDATILWMHEFGVHFDRCRSENKQQTTTSSELHTVGIKNI